MGTYRFNFNHSLQVVNQRKKNGRGRRGCENPGTSEITSDQPRKIRQSNTSRIVVFGVIGSAYFVLFLLIPLPSQNGVPRLIALLQFGNPSILASNWFGDGSSALGVADRIPLVLVAAAIVTFSYVVGRLILELIRADRYLVRGELFVFAVAVGLNLISTYTLAVGLVGGLHQAWTLWLPVVLLILTLLWRTFSRRRDHRRSLRSSCSSGSGPENVESERDAPSPRSVPEAREGSLSRSVEEHSPTGDWLNLAGLIFAIPFLLVMLWGSMMPPVDFDVREYHLQVPKEWYRQGRIEFLPHNVYGNMPLGAQLHSLISMMIMPGERSWWWGALAGKLVLAFFAPLTGLALFMAGRRWFSTTAGVMAAFVYLSTPWIAKVSMNGLVEGALACYLFLAVYVVLVWYQGDGNSPSPAGRSKRDSTGLLLLAGYLAGGAVACKYPGMLFVVAPLFFWIVIGGFALARKTTGAHRRDEGVSRGGFTSGTIYSSWGECFRGAMLFLFAVGLGCGLWLAKNWVFTGNPTYPLLGRIFAGKGVYFHEQWLAAHATPLCDAAHAFESLSQFLFRSEWLSPLLIPLAVLSFVIQRQRRAVLTFSAMAAYVLIAWWLFTHRLDRFWIPVLPIVALLAGIGATWSSARSWRIILMIFLCCGLTLNFVAVSSRLMRVDNRFFRALAPLRIDDPSGTELIDTLNGSRVQVVHRYLSHLAANPEEIGTVLLVGDAEPFDLEMDLVYNTCFDECRFERLMKGRSREDRIKQLSANHISHVYIHWGEIRRYRDTYGFSDYVTPELVEELVDQGLLQFDSGLESYAGLDRVPEEERDRIRKEFRDQFGELYRTRVDHSLQ